MFAHPFGRDDEDVPPPPGLHHRRRMLERGEEAEAGRTHIVGRDRPVRQAERALHQGRRRRDRLIGNRRRVQDRIEVVRRDARICQRGLRRGGR